MSSTMKMGPKENLPKGIHFMKDFRSEVEKTKTPMKLPEELEKLKKADQVKLTRRKNADGEGSDDEEDEDVMEFDRDSVAKAWERKRAEMCKKLKDEVEVEGPISLMARHVQDMSLKEYNPVVATPNEWHPHQQVSVVLSGNMFDTSHDLTMTRLAKMVTNNPSSRAAKRIFFLLAGVFHDIIFKPDSEKPPPQPKKNKNATAEEPEPQPVRISEAERAIMDSNRESFTAAFDRKEVSSTFLSALIRDPAKTFSVPRVAVYCETLYNNLAEPCGVRFFFTVYDPVIDLDKAVEEYIVRSEKRYHKWKTAKETRETAGKGKDPKPFASDGDHTAYLHIRSLADWAKAISDYYDVGHEVHKRLDDMENRDAVGHEKNNFKDKSNPATPTKVLTIDDAFQRQVVGLCKAQATVSRYRKEVSTHRFVYKFPLPFNVHFMEWKVMEPAALHNGRLPSSTAQFCYQKVIKAEMGDAPRGFEIDCTAKQFKLVMENCESNDPLVHGMSELAKVTSVRPDLQTDEEAMRSMDIVEQLKPEFMQRRRQIERDFTPGTPRYIMEMSKFKKESMDMVWRMFFKFETVLPFLSPTSVAAFKNIAQSDASRHWGDWKSPALDLDLSGAMLLKLNLQMTHLYRIKEGSPQRDLMLHLFSSLTSCHHHFNIKVNLLGINSNSTGKSFRLQATERMSLPGSVFRVSHLTANALNVQGNFNYRTYVCEELDPALLGIGAGGKRTETPQQNHLKNVLTAQKSKTAQCHRTEDGQRLQVTALASSICSFQAAMNTPATGESKLGGGKTAEFSRWITEMPSPDFEMTVELRDLVAKLHDEGDAGLLLAFESEMHMFHSIIVVLNMSIGMGFIHEVNNDLGNITMRLLNKKLKEEGYPQMEPRLMEQAAELMVAICIWCSVVTMTASEISFTQCFDKAGNYKPLTADIIRSIEPLLCVTMQHVMFALTLLTPNIIPTTECRIKGVLAQLEVVKRAYPYQWRDNDGQIYWDPRKIVIPCTEAQLASHVRSAMKMDITVQQVAQVLTSLKTATCEGKSLTKISMGDGKEKDIGAQERMARQRQEEEEWTLPILENCFHNYSMLHCGAKGGVVLTKVGIDYENHGAKFMDKANDNELASMIASIFSHHFTHPRTLLTAGVLRDPTSSKVYQRALGVIDISKKNRALIFERTTYVSKADMRGCYDRTRDVHSTPLGNNTVPIMEFFDDCDTVMMAVHHAEAGIAWDQFPLFLPTTMMFWREKIRKVNPQYFNVPGKLQPYDNYRKEWITEHEEELTFRNKHLATNPTEEEVLAHTRDATSSLLTPGSGYHSACAAALAGECEVDYRDDEKPASAFFTSDKADDMMSNLTPHDRHRMLKDVYQWEQDIEADATERPGSLLPLKISKSGRVCSGFQHVSCYAPPKQALLAKRSREARLEDRGTENYHGMPEDDGEELPAFKKPKTLKDLLAEEADDDEEFE